MVDVWVWEVVDEVSSDGAPVALRLLTNLLQAEATLPLSTKVVLAAAWVVAAGEQSIALRSKFETKEKRRLYE